MAFSNGKLTLKTKKDGTLSNSTGTCRVIDNGKRGMSYQQVIVQALPELGFILVNTHKFSPTTSKHFYYLRRAVSEKFPTLKEVFINCSDLYKLLYYKQYDALEGEFIYDETLDVLVKLCLDKESIYAAIEDNKDTLKISKKIKSLGTRFKKLLSFEYLDTYKQWQKLKNEIKLLDTTVLRFISWEQRQDLEKLTLNDCITHREFLSELVDECRLDGPLCEKLKAVDAVSVLKEIGG